MKFLRLDSPLILFLGKMADLMWLNILTLLCCIPVFTAGAALTALQYMALKIVRDEECYITKGYFKAFKENFKQATVIWLIFLAAGIVFFVDYRIITTTEIAIHPLLKTVMMFVGAMVVFTFMFVFAVQGKFSNNVRMTIWNAFVFSVVQFPKTVLMIAFYALPYVILYFYNGLFPAVAVFNLSLPAFLSAKLYNRFFLVMERQILKKMEAAGAGDTAADEEEKIFHDEIQEDLMAGQENGTD